ncbi:MAG: penicillin-binding transpeptidase domain-containing protein, partial [Pseudomonadota bacterium]
MGLEEDVVSLDTRVAAHEAIFLGRTSFTDGPERREPLSVREVFLKSSNVGVGRIALAVGAERQRAFLSRIGLIGPMTTEVRALGTVATPAHWGDVETVTIAYGHGLSVSPMQFAAVTASLLNGGFAVTPSFLPGQTLPRDLGKRVVSDETSARLRELMRANVRDDNGSGSRARVPGLDVGGKTGTADRVGRTGRYDGASVITSFVAAFPMARPRYVVMVTLFDPDRTDASNGERAAAYNAAPTAGRIIERIAPMLGVLPIVNSGR